MWCWQRKPSHSIETGQIIFLYHNANAHACTHTHTNVRMHMSTHTHPCMRVVLGLKTRMWTLNVFDEEKVRTQLSARTDGNFKSTVTWSSLADKGGKGRERERERERERNGDFICFGREGISYSNRQKAWKTKTSPSPVHPSSVFEGL